MNEWKVTKVHVHAQCFSISFTPWEDLLTPQLEKVTIEVSTVQVLTSRANPRRLHRAKHIDSGQTSYLNMKILTFAKDVIF